MISLQITSNNLWKICAMSFSQKLIEQKFESLNDLGHERPATLVTEATIIIVTLVIALLVFLNNSSAFRNWIAA